MLTAADRAELGALITSLLEHQGTAETTEEAQDPDTGFKTDSPTLLEPFPCLLVPVTGEAEAIIAEQEEGVRRFHLLTGWTTRLTPDQTVEVSGGSGEGAWTVRLAVQGEVGELLTETSRRYACREI